MDESHLDRVDFSSTTSAWEKEENDAIISSLKKVAETRPNLVLLDGVFHEIPEDKMDMVHDMASWIPPVDCREEIMRAILEERKTEKQ